MCRRSTLRIGIVDDLPVQMIGKFFFELSNGDVDDDKRQEF